MDIQIGKRLGLDMAQKTQELLMAMTVLTSVHGFTGCGIQGDEQRRGAHSHA